jgi:hypothetical protein
MNFFLRNSSAALFIFAFAGTISACPWCRASVENSVYDRNFFSTLLLLLLPLAIIGGIGFVLYHADKIKRTIRRFK